MILFVGIPTEPPMQLAIESAESRSVPYVVLNQRHFGAVDACLEIGDADPDGRLEISGQGLALSEITGIYYRPMAFEDLPEVRSARRRTVVGDDLERGSLLERLLMDWVEITSGRVVNKPSAMSSNASKPYQSQLISAAGFSTPDTLITNNPADVEAFARRHPRLIFKSISSVRSIVQEWKPKERPVERVKWLPTQFQELIEGADVRVHVVGTRALAVEIRSQAVDYRYASQNGPEPQMEPIDLPEDVASRCIAMTATLGLGFSGIDLIRTPDGRFVCLEVNPSPAYSYFEAGSGQSIASALVSYLSGEID